MTDKEKPSYFKANIDRAAQERELIEETSGGGRDIERIELDYGENRVRVLPAYNEQGDWYQANFIHWNLPVDTERKTYHCSKEWIKDPSSSAWVATGECLFCDAIEPYKEANEEMYKKYKAKLRYDFNAIDLDAPDEGVQILSVPPKDVAEPIFRYAEKYGDPTDPETGYALTITKKKEKKFVRYDVLADRDDTPLEDWSLLEDLWDLRELHEGSTVSLEEQQKIISGKSEESSVEDDAPALNPASDSSDEDEDEDEGDEEDVTKKSASELLAERMRQKSDE